MNSASISRPTAARSSPGGRLCRSRAPALAVMAFVALCGTSCWGGRGCDHGSWGPKGGWQCHDHNDERGPQRDVPPKR